MLKTIKKFAVAATFATVATASVTATAKETLKFGIISTESNQALRSMWTPFLNDLGKQMGVNVKPYFATDYAGIIQAMRFNKVDVAWFGNKSAMEAVDRAGGEIFAQTVAVDGSPGYWSLLITHKDSKLNNVQDVLKNSKSLVFGNGDPNSTSGFLVPSYYVFAKNNVDPSKAFKRVLNSNHETNALAVANKKVDVATNNTENVARIKATFPEKYKQIKVLWKSPLIPSDPIVWRKNLPAAQKAQIKDFFMAYGKSGDKKELANLKKLTWAPFRDSNNDQLLPIRQLSLFKQRTKLIKKGKSVNSPEIKKIDKQLQQLKARKAMIKKAG